MHTCGMTSASCHHDSGDKALSKQSNIHRWLFNFGQYAQNLTEDDMAARPAVFDSVKEWKKLDRNTSLIRKGAEAELSMKRNYMLFLEGEANMARVATSFGSIEVVIWWRRKPLLVTEDLCTHSRPARPGASTVHVYRSLGSFKVALNRVRETVVYLTLCSRSAHRAMLFNFVASSPPAQET